MLRLSVAVALVAGACAGVVACGGAKAPMKMEQTSGAKPPPPPPGGGAHGQIEQLEAEIAASRTQLELAEPTDPELQGVPAEPLSKPPALQDPQCKPAKTETCTTSCTLSDSICGNAEKICKLAVQINDDWARGRCAKANKTCEASRTKCCGCQ